MGLGTLRKSVLEKWSRGVVVKIPWEMMHGYEGQTKELSNLHVMRIYIKDAKGATGNLKIFSTPPPTTCQLSVAILEIMFPEHIHL